MRAKRERYLDVSGTGIRVESPPLATINALLVKYRRSGAFCDGHRGDASGLRVDVANE